MKLLSAVLAAGFAATSTAYAQSATRARAPEPLESYSAYIGRDDLYNSSGERLTKPWQIIRQYRANYHRYGMRDRGDEGDSFFADEVNRQNLESMMAKWLNVFNRTADDFAR
ncbi:hypothetical protein [Rhizobium sp. FKY42]|uniref:hypothetical protein n=1 Tax=Rhizobium sp. FKY42 TaxID=2562310 RepID=UPI001FEED44C|nr:hypothetical protein [Rhizobium sp. FKY42]